MSNQPNDPSQPDDLGAPPLKTDPRYGHFPWWPEDGDDWVHPEDVQLARRTIPSDRVWRLDEPGAKRGEGGFVTLSYGDDRLRVRPRLWQLTPKPKFWIGELVEVLPHGMQNDPVTGHVRDITWDESSKEIHYQLDVTDRVVEANFTAADLKPVHPTSGEEELRIEPPEDDADVDALVEGLPSADRKPPAG